MSGRVERLRGDPADVVALIGDLDMTDVAELRGLLHEVAGETNRVVVDMTDATFIDSTVMAALLLTQRDGCVVVLRGAHGEPRRALDIAGVLDVVELED